MSQSGEEHAGRLARAWVSAAADANAWDEMASGRGEIRAHWRPLFAVLAQLGATGLAQRGLRLRQHLEDDGVTFNLYAAGTGRAGQDGALDARPWILDAIPLLLPAAEWRAIERGIAQRARLFDLVLADLHGPQKLLAERRYPPRLVLGSPEFLRACRGDGPTAPGHFVQHYAADLARGPDGRWRVVGDRLQAPAGAAFALHHRRAMARAMGEALAVQDIRRLGGFFETWATDLRARAPSRTENPRVVVLTPGPFNEAHAEHAALARELGASLAQGSDLTARDGCVHLKTLGGLERVDTILRRVDAAWCDPLELRADSALGVAGLVDAVRHGGVHVANALGAALVEAPAMAAFLPRLAEHLLGEDLALPSIATWWCGQSYALEEVLARMPELVLRSALAPDGRIFTVDRAEHGAREAMIAALRATPFDFVAQQRMVPSVAPGEGMAGLHPQPIVLRVFATADRGGYSVMPGGLARVPAGSDPLRPGLQQGGLNKDVWIVDDQGNDRARAGVALRAPIVIRRTSGEVPSRAADDLFWLGRSVERVDGCSRVVRAGLERAVAVSWGARERTEMAVILRVLEAGGVVPIDGSAAAPDAPHARMLLLGAFAPGGLPEATLTTIERLSAAVRDRFSVDMRRTLSHLLGDLRGRIGAIDADAGRLLDLLDELLRMSAALAGLASENMTRGSGWRFLDLGRRVERGIHVARVVRSAIEVPQGAWEAGLRLALELCDSTISYRTRYLAALLDAPVLDLVLRDASNPQSLAFQIDGVRAHLAALPRTAGAPSGDDLVAVLRDISAIVDTLGGAGKAGRSGAIDALRHAALAVEARLMTLSDDLNGAFFAHVAAARIVGAE